MFCVYLCLCMLEGDEYRLVWDVFPEHSWFVQWGFGRRKWMWGHEWVTLLVGFGWWRQWCVGDDGRVLVFPGSFLSVLCRSW